MEVPSFRRILFLILWQEPSWILSKLLGVNTPITFSLWHVGFSKQPADVLLDTETTILSTLATARLDQSEGAGIKQSPVKLQVAFVTSKSSLKHGITWPYGCHSPYWHMYSLSSWTNCDLQGTRHLCPWFEYKQVWLVEFSSPASLEYILFRHVDFRHFGYLNFFPSEQFAINAREWFWGA